MVGMDENVMVLNTIYANRSNAERAVQYAAPKYQRRTTSSERNSGTISLLILTRRWRVFYCLLYSKCLNLARWMNQGQGSDWYE